MRTISWLAPLAGTILCASVASAQQRLAVLTEPGTPVVATELLLTVGPLDEKEAEVGITYLAARSAIAPVTTALDSLGARVTITPQKDALSISVVAAPDAWQEATTAVLDALFRAPPQREAVARERRDIANELRGRAANPADAATAEADQAFFGLGHPWGRPTVGTPGSIERVPIEDVEQFLRANFTPDRTLAAVAGPVDEADAREHLLPLLGSTAPAAVEVDPFRPAERVVREPYNSITTWVTASFPFPETADEEAIRFLGHLAAEALSYAPSRRSVYNVTSQVRPRVGGGELRLQLVVPPEEAEEWEELVEETVDALAERTFLPDVFDNHLRRYRGERLMALISPEDRAHEAARQLLVEGRYTGLVPDLTEISQARVREAARSIGAPTIVLLGPVLDP